MTARRVLVDANVFLSFLIERNEPQHASAKALVDAMSAGEIEAFVTQFAIFEITYVLQSFYAMPPRQTAEVIRDLIALPGLTVVDDCPWRAVFEYWPEALSGLADAATVAIAKAGQYDGIATFDQKMIKRMRSQAVDSYF